MAIPLFLASLLTQGGRLGASTLMRGLLAKKAATEGGKRLLTNTGNVAQATGFGNIAPAAGRLGQATMQAARTPQGKAMLGAGLATMSAAPLFEETPIPQRPQSKRDEIINSGLGTILSNEQLDSRGITRQETLPTVAGQDPVTLNQPPISQPPVNQPPTDQQGVADTLEATDVVGGGGAGQDTVSGGQGLSSFIAGLDTEALDKIASDPQASQADRGAASFISAFKRGKDASSDKAFGVQVKKALESGDIDDLLPLVAGADTESKQKMIGRVFTAKKESDALAVSQAKQVQKAQEAAAENKGLTVGGIVMPGGADSKQKQEIFEGIDAVKDFGTNVFGMAKLTHEGTSTLPLLDSPTTKRLKNLKKERAVTKLNVAMDQGAITGTDAPRMESTLGDVFSITVSEDNARDILTNVASDIFTDQNNTIRSQGGTISPSELKAQDLMLGAIRAGTAVPIVKNLRGQNLSNNQIVDFMEKMGFSRLQAQESVLEASK